MKRTHLFTKTTKSAPAEEPSRNAQLLLRAGYVHKQMAGVYEYLPLGLRVIENIKQIVREEMNSLGGQELSLTALQSKTEWEKTGRWNSEKIDIWFKTELSAGGEAGLAPTHEEPITKMLTSHVSSYKDLPLYLYQFQTKFRNELRAKSGIMRTREFIMKDMYSFTTDEASHQEFYEKAAAAYLRIYERLGLAADTYRTFASGGIFSPFSDEFQTLCDVGEDTIYLDRSKRIAVNEEVYNDETLEMLGLNKNNLEKVTAAEVGNIFTLGTKYSEPLDLSFNDENGKRNYAYMGCYGIGIGRTMGVIAEKYSDDKGLIWPEAIAPFLYYLIGIGDQGLAKAAELYKQFPGKFLWDDRSEARVGEKFADAELLGIPHRIVISDKTLADQQVEIISRQNGTKKLLTLEQFIPKLG